MGPQCRAGWSYCADHGVGATSARLVAGVLRVIGEMDHYGAMAGDCSFFITANDGVEG